MPRKRKARRKSGRVPAPPDVTDERVIQRFLKRQAEVTRPRFELIDRALAESRAKAHHKAVWR